MTDEIIVQRVLEGNTHIFSELVNRYKDRVYAMACNFIGDYSEAQDLSQEVFIKVFGSLHLFKGGSSFSTWLYRICYNMCIDWIRKNKKKWIRACENYEDNDRPDASADVENNYIAACKRNSVITGVNSLKDKYRAVIVLFHFNNLSYEDIAHILKIPVKTVETRLYRGRNQLKKLLAAELSGGGKYEMQAGS